MRTLTLGIGLGVLAGAAIATATINQAYPDVPKRMLRDGRRAVRTTKRTLGSLLG